MKLTENSIRPLTNLYWLARQSRLLDTAFGKKFFSQSYFLYKRYFEDPYNILVERHPNFFLGGNILDIGANIGYTATVFDRAVSPDYRVYAFEPEPFNFEMLERVARKAPARIVPIQSAVGDQDGTIALWENKHHHGDHRILTDQFRQCVAKSGALAVPITSVDTFISNQRGDFPIRFIKIDVQGYELPVCKGMDRTLAANPRAIVALEYMPSAMRQLGFEPEELLRRFREQGYKVYRIAKHGRLSLGVGGTSEGGYCDLIFSRENLSEPA